jgi:hypothetical protein
MMRMEFLCVLDYKFARRFLARDLTQKLRFFRLSCNTYANANIKDACHSRVSVESKDDF